MAKPVSQFRIGVREENGKHFACLIYMDSDEIDYASPPCESLEDAINDVHVELTLRHAAKGEIVEIKTKKQLEDEELD